VGSAWAEINVDALIFNVGVVRKRAPHSKVCAVVKANAYGHGLEEVVRALSPHVDAFAVAHCAEASRVRAVELEKPVWVFLGFRDQEELLQCVRERLTPVLSSDHQVACLRTIPGQAVSVVVEHDVGMGRLGLTNEEVEAALEFLSQQEHVHVEAVLGHFSGSEDPDRTQTNRQQDRFLQANKPRLIDLSLANSAAILGQPESHLQWVRPGLMLYGVSPRNGETGTTVGLKPVINVFAQLGGIRWMEAGDTIGYGSTYVCEQRMRVGLVCFGYADGYPRKARSTGEVVVRDARARILGRVAMDSMMIDLTGIPDALPGDPVEVWGERMPVEEVAQKNSALAHQILTSLGPRVTRVFSP